VLSQVLQGTFFNEPIEGLSSEELEKRRKIYEYFGSFTRCLLSMFELTLANWPPVTRLLSEELHEVYSLLCVIHKLTIGFAVIGVINGVIMQETFKVASTDDTIMLRQKKKTAEMSKTKMTKLFESLDDSGDGSLDWEEFEAVACNPEVRTWLAAQDIETDDLHTLFTLIDEDGSGSITAEELARRMPRIKGAARSIDLMAMRRSNANGQALALVDSVDVDAEKPDAESPRKADVFPQVLSENLPLCADDERSIPCNIPLARESSLSSI